jgi:hypothetical protein
LPSSLSCWWRRPPAVTSGKNGNLQGGRRSQQLQGSKRDAFIKKCMGGGNYEPAARKNAAKQTAPKPQ